MKKKYCKFISGKTSKVGEKLILSNSFKEKRNLDTKVYEDKFGFN